MQLRSTYKDNRCVQKSKISRSALKHFCWVTCSANPTHSISPCLFQKLFFPTLNRIAKFCSSHDPITIARYWSPNFYFAWASRLYFGRLSLVPREPLLLFYLTKLRDATLTNIRSLTLTFVAFWSNSPACHSFKCFCVNAGSSLSPTCVFNKKPPCQSCTGNGTVSLHFRQ